MMAAQTKAPSEPLPMEVTTYDKEKADEIKSEANKLFQSGILERAIEKYTEAISYNPYCATYYSNRSFANFKMEYYHAALLDASKSIEIDPSYVKGYYRRASANMALGKLKEAIKDFKCVIKVAPTDAQARKKCESCEKEYRRIQFEKAIFVDSSTKSAVEALGDIESITIDDSYSGPKFD